MRVTIGSALLMGLLNFAVGGVPHNRPNRSAVESPEEFRWLEGSVATAYHFPWSCILYFQMRTSFKTPTSDLRDDYMFGSSCTIFSDRWVIVSLEALNTIHWGLRLFPVFSQRERVKKGAIVIQAGAQHAIFYTNENRKQLDPDSDSQQVGAEDLYVLLEPSLVAYLPTLRETFDEIVSTKQYIAKNPRNITYGTNKTVFDVKAFGMSSAFVKTNFSFDWTPYVQPMRISDPALIRLEQTTYKVINDLNFMNNGGNTVCFIHTWQPRTFTMRYQSVTYVGIDDCRATYCAKFPETCFLFPFREFDVCFAPINFGDICEHDLGSALYCKWFQSSVLAIAKYNTNCGFDGTPSVYTLTPAIVRFWFLLNGAVEEEIVSGRPDALKYYTEFSLGDVSGTDEIPTVQDDNNDEYI